jgi:hypothetical protein
MGSVKLGDLVACPRCGKLCPDNNASCPACGAALSDAGAEAPLALEVSAPARAPSVAAPPTPIAVPAGGAEAPLAVDAPAVSSGGGFRRGQQRSRSEAVIAPPDDAALEVEANAELAWGKDPDEVRNLLVRKGMDGARAQQLIARLVTERDKRFRARGVLDLAVGGVVGAVGLSLMFTVGMRVGMGGIFGIGLVAVYGGWRALRGIMRLLVGGRGEAEGTDTGP